MSTSRRTIDENYVKLEREMETLRTQLYLATRGERQQLATDEAYRLSLRLDNLIVQYMRAYA